MIRFFTLLFPLISYISCWSQIPAFPGAEGFGANTIGGRGGQVLKVTNLDDHGPGSLRAAIETEGPRIIIFEVGGIINLETELSVRNPFITIAGQSAPGDGICLRGECLRIYTHDVVIRYIRSRPGDIDFGVSNEWEAIDAMSVQGDAYNVVIDHCSLSWAVDENIDVWQRAHDITIQHCILAEALKHSKHPKGAHSMGMIIGSKATRVSVHHNLFAHNNDRNPHMNGRSVVDFRNNIVYNPGGVAMDVGAARNQVLNYVNNQIIDGPNTNLLGDIVIRNLARDLPKVYISGNIGVNATFKKVYTYSNSSEDILSFRSPEDLAVIQELELSEPYTAPEVTTVPASALKSYLLNNVGATLPRRDPVDAEVIRDVQKRGHGMVNHKNTLLAWPPYESGFAFLDSDNDGMPDHWEEAFNLDPNKPDHNQDSDNDGYTNIEEYLNQTSPVLTGAIAPASSNSPLNIDDVSISTPSLNFEFIEYFPNPFIDKLDMKFSVNQPSQVSIRVFNMLGREVNELVNSFLYEGKYEIIWDSTNMKAGLYQIVIASKSHSDGIKVVLSR